MPANGRILVTGADGFVGRHVLPRLNRLFPGATLIAAIRDAEGELLLPDAATAGERKNPGLSGGEKVVRFRSQSAIQHRGADDGDAMSALRGPSHPLLLGHASIGDLVDATLCPRG